MNDKPDQSNTVAVIERMMQAGWIRASARTNEIAASELTPEGVVAIRLLRRFLSQNEGKLSTPDLATFLALIAHPNLQFVHQTPG